MDLLANMWVAPERGRLKGTTESLARLCRCDDDDMAAAIEELENTGAANVTRNGKVTGSHKNITVACRRMLRDEAARKSNADRQSRHREKLSHEDNAENNDEVTPPSASAVSATASAPAQNNNSVTNESLENPPTKKRRRRQDKPENPEAAAVYDHWLASDIPREVTPQRKQSVINIGHLFDEGHTADDLKAAADNYATEIALTGKTTCFYVVSNFYGTKAYYAAYLPGVWKPPEGTKKGSILDALRENDNVDA